MSAKIVFFLCHGLALAYGFDSTHAEWDAILKVRVTVNGPVSTVDYKTLKSNRSGLDKYVSSVEALSRAEYNAFKEEEKLAFLINAYNALTVKLIVDNYPVKSIKDIGNIFKSSWKKKFFKLFGEDYHLDGIEHEILRKQFAEPRIHFSIVCASKGCPQLRGEAYVASRLEEQLQDQTKRFLKDKARNYFVSEKNTLYLSKIFKWFKEDFEKKAGSVSKFVAPFMAQDPTEEAKIKQADVDTLDYDWTLNEAG